VPTATFRVELLDSEVTGYTSSQGSDRQEITFCDFHIHRTMEDREQDTKSSTATNAEDDAEPTIDDVAEMNAVTEAYIATLTFIVIKVCNCCGSRIHRLVSSTFYIQTVLSGGSSQVGPHIQT